VIPAAAATLALTGITEPGYSVHLNLRPRHFHSS
jgi:hypothetical protein